MAPISNELFRNSLRHVRRELKTLGFNRKKVMETQVSRTPLPSFRKQAYFTHDGKIFVPMFQSKKNVRDMLRHEYGHSLLFNYPKIAMKNEFINFGHSIDVNDYLTNYAMKNPDEDFCETFMTYMKHHGKLPHKHVSPRMMKKWRFINGLRTRRGSS
jgi:hypothetical protein